MKTGEVSIRALRRQKRGGVIAREKSNILTMTMVRREEDEEGVFWFREVWAFPQRVACACAPCVEARRHNVRLMPGLWRPIRKVRSRKWCLKFARRTLLR